MTALHLDPGQPGDVHLETAPAPYVASLAGQYVHMPRSVHQHVSLFDHQRREIVNAWCGIMLYTMHPDRRAEWIDEIPADRPLCGTCKGRHEGYDPGTPEVAFRPTKSLSSLGRRRWCPGPRSNLWVEHGRGGVCILCGHVDRQWGRSMRNHAPEVPEALLFCPSCGWEHLSMRQADGVTAVVCTRFRCTFVATVTVEVPPSIVTVEHRPDLGLQRP